jgi:hypothetical protein
VAGSCEYGSESLAFVKGRFFFGGGGSFLSYNYFSSRTLGAGIATRLGLDV